MKKNSFAGMFVAAVLALMLGEGWAEDQKSVKIPVQVGPDQTAADAFKRDEADDWDLEGSAWDDMQRMRSRLSRFWNNDALSPDPAMFAVNPNRFSGGSSADFFEDEGEITVKVDVPGFSREELEVLVEGGDLVIRGKKMAQFEEEDPTGKAQYRGRRSGSFERRFLIPPHADMDRIDATQENGVLTLRIPKTDAPKPQTIKIRGQGEKT